MLIVKILLVALGFKFPLALFLSLSSIAAFIFVIIKPLNLKISSEWLKFYFKKTIIYIKFESKKKKYLRIYLEYFHGWEKDTYIQIVTFILL